MRAVNMLPLPRSSDRRGVQPRLLVVRRRPLLPVRRRVDHGWWLSTVGVPPRGPQDREQGRIPRLRLWLWLEPDAPRGDEPTYERLWPTCGAPALGVEDRLAPATFAPRELRRNTSDTCDAVEGEILALENPEQQRAPRHVCASDLTHRAAPTLLLCLRVMRRTMLRGRRPCDDISGQDRGKQRGRRRGGRGRAPDCQRRTAGSSSVGTGSRHPGVQLGKYIVTIDDDIMGKLDENCQPRSSYQVNKPVNKARRRWPAQRRCTYHWCKSWESNRPCHHDRLSRRSILRH